MDESVGTIVTALRKENMLNNSIIVFSTDNGGAGDKYHGAVGSNYPLRGVSSTKNEPNEWLPTLTFLNR